MINDEKLPSPLSYRRGQLYFDGKKILNLAKDLPTPFYLYSEATMLNSLQLFMQAALENQVENPLVCFALKANPNLQLLKSLAKQDVGADIVSGGELQRALEAGIDPQKIVFSGVGKTEAEITQALKCSSQGIYSFNVESYEELILINQCAKKCKKTARVALRFNPQVHAKTHKHISTGYKTHKFGIVREDLLGILKKMKRMPNVKAVGLSMHIGSQLTCLKATKKAIKQLCETALESKLNLEFLDVGGGLGVNYRRVPDSKVSSPGEYMRTIAETIEKNYYRKLPKKFIRARIVFEPGRFIVAEAGVLVTKIVRNKKSADCHFTVVDGGMNDFIRTSLYDAYHRVLPAKWNNAKTITTNVVGPICETADKFATDLNLPPMKSGDFLCICDTGAYGFSMASHYNMRAKPQEYVLTQKGELSLP